MQLLLRNTQTELVEANGPPSLLSKEKKKWILFRAGGREGRIQSSQRFPYGYLVTNESNLNPYLPQSIPSPG